jgi:pimeloyl-ACP methyl ester carboxylesterase
MSGGFSPTHRGGSGPPLLCLHGITDTWRTWELVLPALEGRHDVLAPTLAGHAGGPPLAGDPSDAALADAIERAMDEAGFETAHIAGNSLGGWLSLQLAARGRAETVVALAPTGGWVEGDRWQEERQSHFTRMHELAQGAAPRADEIAASGEGRRRATRNITTNFEHIPSDLIAHQIRGVAACDLAPLLDYELEAGWNLDAERITCPVRIVWGTADRILRWPTAAERYRTEWLPNADWVELEGVGHCPQLDVPLETAELILSFSSARAS